MDKEGCFHDTSATFQECAPIRLVRYRHIHVTLLGLHNIYPYSTKAKNMGKITVLVLFACLCTKYLEPGYAATWSNCKQSHALSTNNEVCMTSVQKVHCCASSTVVLSLVYVMQHSSSVWIHLGKKSKRQKGFFRCCLKVFVHWTWNQDGLLIDRTVPKFMHYAQTTDKKAWIFQKIHNSISCIVVFMKHV